MNDKALLSTKVLNALQYRDGLDRPSNNVVEYDQGVWLVVKGTTGVMQVLPNGTVFEFKKRLRIFTHILAGHYDSWTLERHPLPEPEISDNMATDLGIANASAFAYEVAIVKDGEGWKAEMSDGTKEAVNEVRGAYHTWLNWFIKGHSVVLRIPQFKAHAEYMKVVDTTLHAPKDQVWDMYQKHIEEAREERETYKVQRPFIQNGEGDKVNATPRTPKFLVTNLKGEKVDMADEPDGKEFGVYGSAGNFMFPIAWRPDDEKVMEGWKALVAAKYLRVGDPQ